MAELAARSSELLTDDNVSLCGLLLDQIIVVKVAVDDVDVGISLLKLASLVLGSDQGGVGPIGVSLVKSIQGISADIAGGTCADSDFRNRG